MRIRLNGEQREVPDGTTVLALLMDSGLIKPGLPPNRQGVAVERNREVIPGSQLAEVRLAPGDELEIVTAFPGG